MTIIKNMPYKSNADLPQDIQEHLPKHAEDIYREAFNSAWHEYGKGKTHDQLEATAAKVAWSAVKNEYKKDDNGQWVKKSNS